MMNKYTLFLLAFLLPLFFTQAQLFNPDDYCLVWSDEFNTNGAPSTANWRYEEGYVRNNEDQYYTNARLENARCEGGNLVLEARRDNWNGHEYTSASLVSWGKVVHKYGRFEVRAKIDARVGSWPAFWTLGESGEWPSNGEIDIMEFYNGKIHANLAWGTATRWQGKWDSQNRNVSSFPTGWANEFHVWRMEWTPQFIHLYVDDILMNSTDLSTTINDNDSPIRNPFQQPHYIILNQAIGGNNGGDPSGTTFPVRYLVDYVRVYQLGNCKLDCNWQEGGTAHLDDCLNCVGGTTGKTPCTLTCNGNLVKNPSFESGGIATWEGWGTRSAVTSGTNVFAGSASVQIGEGAIEQVVAVAPNTKYTLKAKGKKSGGGWYRLGVKEHGSGETYKEATNNAWADVSLDFTTGASTSARIYLYNGNGGTAYGDDIQLQPAGCFLTPVLEENSESMLTLFPNPSEKNFHLTVPEPGVVRIMNANGQMMEEWLADKQLTYGESLPAGCYTIHFMSDKRSEVLSWIKL